MRVGSTGSGGVGGCAKPGPRRLVRCPVSRLSHLISPRWLEKYSSSGGAHKEIRRDSRDDGTHWACGSHSCVANSYGAQAAAGESGRPAENPAPRGGRRVARERRGVCTGTHTRLSKPENGAYRDDKLSLYPLSYPFQVVFPS